MNSAIAQKLGVKIIMRFTIIGALVAIFLISLLFSTKGIEYAFEWITKISTPLIFGLFGLLLGSYIAGRIAGFMIFKKHNAVVWGIVSAITVVWISVLTSSIYLVIYEIFQSPFSIEELIEDYLFKPLYWISLIGSFPIILLGTFYGIKLKNKMDAVLKN
jgi:hypothetical protein